MPERTTEVDFHPLKYVILNFENYMSKLIWSLTKDKWCQIH